MIQEVYDELRRQRELEAMPDDGPELPRREHPLTAEEFAELAQSSTSFAEGAADERDLAMSTISTAVITIDDEFQALIPPLTDDEFRQLEASILAEGVRDPLVVWEGILLDGHHRMRIADTHGILYEVVERNLPDRNAAMAWIIKNQFARRNLTPYQRCELALKLEDLVSPGQAAPTAKRLPGLPRVASKPTGPTGNTSAATGPQTRR